MVSIGFFFCIPEKTDGNYLASKRFFTFDYIVCTVGWREGVLNVAMFHVRFVVVGRSRV